MRVAVVREYIDKYTGKAHAIGEKLDMTEERFAEIQKRGMFVVDISEVVQQVTPAVPAELVADREQKTESEQAEPVKQQETSEPPKQDKPAKGGRRNRAKKESEE